MIENVLILAGGSGTRLWPVSSKSRPKQYIQIRRKEGTSSLLKMTLERAAALEPKRIMIITLKSQADLAEHEMSLWKNDTKLTVPDMFVLTEPEPRNTAPAIAAGVSYISACGGENETNLVLASDHLVSPVSAFADDSRKAAELTAEGYIVTYGIKPLRPETGYGYIKTGNILKSGFKVEQFCEKPDADTAEEFIKAGCYYWNSGMFMFKTDVFMSELKEHAEDVWNTFQTICSSAPESLEKKSSDIARLLDNPEAAAVYRESPSISVDYAVMEKTDKAAMVPSSYDWNDIGSWDEFARLFPEHSPDSWEIDSSGNYVYSDLPVALVGVKDLIITVHEGKILICKKGSSQSVKSVIEMLKEEDRSELL